MPIAESICQVLQPFLARHPVQLLVLFGSYSRGQAGPHSDIDLGVMLDAPFDTWKVSNEIMALLNSGDADLIDLRRANPLLAMAIATHGQVLFERTPGLFHQFQSLAARRYADSAPMRQLGQGYIDAMLRRLGA